MQLYFSVLLVVSALLLYVVKALTAMRRKVRNARKWCNRAPRRHREAMRREQKMQQVSAIAPYLE